VCTKMGGVGDSCYAPEGGLGYSVHHRCPCKKGLKCQTYRAHWLHELFFGVRRLCIEHATPTSVTATNATATNVTATNATATNVTATNATINIVTTLSTIINDSSDDTGDDSGDDNDLE
jgi:hypothetical protein